MFIPYSYSFTGVTAELFAAARQAGISLRSTGPAADIVWVLLADDGWVSAPREAMPLLLGAINVDDALDAVLMVNGVLGSLTDDEHRDAVEMLARAGAEGGGRCR